MPLQLLTEREALGIEVFNVAMQTCRRFCPHAPISAGYLEIAHREFVIRHTTPFTRRMSGFANYPVSYFGLEIHFSGRRVYQVSWNGDERNRHISWHAPFGEYDWEPQFLREHNSLLSEGAPMARKVLKRELRRVAAIVKQQFGYSIEDVGGPGIGPGVRLLARKGLAKIQIAVRTSHDRKVGLTRTKNGTWRTIPDVQEVLVAVIPDDDPTMVEIFCFEADNLQEAFERRLKYEPELRVSPDGSYPPVFMALDPIKNDEKFIKSNLQRKKSWSRRLPLTSGESAKPSITALRDFTDRTLKEYAAIVGADVADVVVEFRVVGRGNRE